MAVAVQPNARPSRQTPAQLPGRDTPRPRLVVVERGSRLVWVISLSALGLCCLLFFTAILRTELAKQQLRLDNLNRSVIMARDHYNDLRHERAFLESPGRLSSEAAKLGMKPAGNARFVPVDADVVATVLASTGDLMDRVAEEATSPLDQFGRIKSEVDGAP
ncbi:MAG: hypothetical protein EBU67_04590 [Actinobacteria bacterium]|jgi:hypothetical protein|nr:hypothetical protein [Actinomycetota bacterium]NBP53564.1 hypothetical protein [Actinomycetota bacterium]